MSDALPKQNSAIELSKSVLVIPVVVAVVMGIGYGLVRLSERKQTATGLPDAQPLVINPDGSIELPIQFAQVKGELVYRSGKRSTLSNWRHLEDSATWHFPVEKAGRYAVEIEYACDEANAGSQLQIELAGATLTAEIPSTSTSAMFKTLRVGEVNIPATGWHDLRVLAQRIAHENVMTLRAVKLVPLKA